MADKFELHYFFYDEDKSHSMDAFVRNKCEHAVLQIVSAISNKLDIQIKVETEAYEEGGLKELYTFFGTVEGQAIITLSNFVIAILSVILSRVPLKKSKLDKEEQKLGIEEKKLNIELLKIELESKQIERHNINIENLDYLISNDIKIIKYKSNFYKSLYNYHKVIQISTVTLDENQKELEEPKIIERKDFEKFILESDILEPIVDESAAIEIISPVLKRGKFKWRGIYDKTLSPIEFSMKDRQFREDIVKSGISFKSGTFIDCILKIERKIDDLGNIFNSNYSVITVLRQHDEEYSFETSQGKKYRNKKEADNSQLNLFKRSDNSSN